MNIQESVTEINKLEDKLFKCEDDLKKINKEIEELLSIEKKNKEGRKKKTQKKKKT